MISTTDRWRREIGMAEMTPCRDRGERMVQTFLNFFDEHGVVDAAGIRLTAASRKRLKSLIREVQDEARF